VEGSIILNEVHLKLAGSEGVDSGHMLASDPVSKTFEHDTEVSAAIEGIFAQECKLKILSLSHSCTL
jgi:hypothetical protein